MIKKGIILIAILFTSFYTSFGQKDEKNKKSFLKIIWGNQIESSISFLPVAVHTIHSNVFFDWYTACSYKGLEVGVFRNSFSDWTVGLFYKRAWNFNKRFSINAGGGLLYGYNGKLGGIHHIPLRNTILFTGPINPAAGIGLDYKITKKIAIRIDIAPLVVISGVRYIL